VQLAYDFVFVLLLKYNVGLKFICIIVKSEIQNNNIVYYTLGLTGAD